jgi:hypothetical protein
MELQFLLLPKSANAAAAFDSASADAPRPAAKHFDDILGQTLAGPLFATWTPIAQINPVASPPGSTGSSVSALDPDARRSSRKRQRR